MASLPNTVASRGTTWSSRWTLELEDDRSRAGGEVRKE